MNSNPIWDPSPANKMKCLFLDYVQLLMISRACQWTWTPSTTCLQAKKLNAHILIMFNFWCWPGWSMDLNPICHSSPAKKMKCSFLDYVHFWWSAWLIDELEPHLPPLSTHKNEMLNFRLRSTSDDQPSWSIDSKSICHPSPANKMKCFFLDYVQLLMISQAGWWTRTPSATLLQPKKWNAHFWIMFNLDDQPGWSMDSNPIHHLSPANKMKCSLLDYVQFGWSARLVDGLKPHPPPLSSQRNEMLIFVLCSTSNDWLGWSMDSNPIHHRLSSQRNEMLIFVLCSTSNDWPGWSMDSNPIHHLSPAKEMKCSFLYYVQLLMLARLVNGLEPHPPPLSSQKMKCSFFGLCSTSDVGQTGQWTQTPSTTPLQPKNEMLIFWLCSTSDDWPGWSMDSNPIYHPSPAKKMKCSFLDYVQLLMMASWAGPANKMKWTDEPHDSPPVSCQKNEMLIFWLCSTSDDQPGWSMDLNPICHPLQPKKWNVLFGLRSLLMISLAGWWTWTPSATPLQPKKWNAHFRLRSTSDDQPGWSMVNGLEPHLPPFSSQKNEMLIFWIMFNFWWSARLVDGLKPHPSPSPANKMKCSFLDYVQLLMISWAGQWTQTPSTTPLQPKKWNAHILIMFNFWWSARLVNGLKPHPPPSPAKKMKCYFLDYVQLLMISWAGQWTQTPSASPLQPKNEMLTFWIMFNFWWSAGLVNGLKPHLPALSSQKNEMLIFDYVQLLMIGWAGRWTRTPSPPLSSQRNEMLIFGLCSLLDDQPGWSMDSNPIHQPSPANKMKYSFLDYVHFWWSAWLIDELEPHLPPLSNHKKEMLNFRLRSTSDDQPGWSMDSNPICHPSKAKKIKCSLLDYVHFWWSARLVDGLKPHPSTLSSQ